MSPPGPSDESSNSAEKIDVQGQQQQQPPPSGNPHEQQSQPRINETEANSEVQNLEELRAGHEALRTFPHSLEQDGVQVSKGVLDSSVDQSRETSASYSSGFPHPDLTLPIPSLALDFRMAVGLNPRVSVGMTPLGHRNWISFTGGSWSATWGSGTVMPGGQDSQIITSNGSARIETTYLLETNDEPAAHIVIKTEGWRTGTPEVLEALADPVRADHVDPASYMFRLFIRLETGDVRYADRVNYGLWVGSGMRRGAEVVYDAYRIS